MKIAQKQPLSKSLICAGLLLTGAIVSTQAAATVPEDPDTFLTFLERYVPEDAVSATAYYDAVDPDGKKTTYKDWLVETGFIEASDFATSGQMDLNDDVTSVLHKNETDLGFVRAVSMRCVPNCNHRNPDIYSLIENYANFEDAAARENRLASVTMEWTAAADGTRPNKKFVVFYAFTGTTATTPEDFRDTRDQSPDTPFAPDLDGRGNKEVPGVCNSCHGGTPLKLKKNGDYRRKGNTGSLFLALDLDNFGFGSEVDTNVLSRAAQQAAYKQQNQAVLITHRGPEEFDEEAEIWRVPAGQEVIEGWYGGPGMPGDTFDGEFVPPGWLPPAAPEEAEKLYLSSVVPACRACHAQQERALDFATYEGFMVFEDAHKDLVLRVECGLDDDSNTRTGGGDDQAVMPLAKLTYEIFWSGSQVKVFKDHIGDVDCGN